MASLYVTLMDVVARALFDQIISRKSAERQQPVEEELGGDWKLHGSGHGWRQNPL